MAKKDYNFDFLDAKAGDALFSNSAKTAKDDKNTIQYIKLADLEKYHNHTFQVKDDEDMADLVESIKENGVITPLTVRKKGDKYEMISGHRRKFASERAGLTEVPCIVLDIDDDHADVLMVDSNSQRPYIMPSEKAFSYKVKMEALKRQGKRTDLDESQPFDSLEALSNDSQDSKSKIKRYIRLTYLKKELLDMIDEGKMKMSSGVLLSYATGPAQEAVYDAITETGKMVNMEDAEKIRSLSVNKKKVTKEYVIELLTGGKKEAPKIKFNENAFKELIPKTVLKLPIEKRINYHKRALEIYAKYIEQNPDEINNI